MLDVVHPQDPPMAPRQPWLHELAICVNGNSTAVGGADGQIVPPGAQGFYVDDSRVLSRFTVQLGDEPAAPQGSASSGARSEFWAAARHLGAEGADPTVEVHRRREVVPSGLRETFQVVSRAPEPLRAGLVLHLAGDGADVGVVKAGLPGGPPLTARLTPDGLGLSWSDDRHETTIRFEPAPELLAPGDADAPAEARFVVAASPGHPGTVRVSIEVRRLAVSNLDADTGAGLVDWSRITVEAQDPRLDHAVQASLDDLRHLLLTDPEAPADIFAAAGTPWYLTLFGRDSIWAARMMLPFGTELAAGTLRTLARRQGTRVDERTAEAPGKIPHELRRTASADPLPSGLALPSTYYGTIDATALWVVLLHDAWRWGMPAAQVEALLPQLRAAARWLTDFSTPDGDGLLRYIDRSGTGLANQGWKDSSDAVRWRDGVVAEAPIALVEAQAYAIEAADAAAALFDAFGDDGGEALRTWATVLRTRVRDSFWVGEQADRYLAIAVDGQGRSVDGKASNMGHVLGTGTLDADEVARVSATLTSAPLLGPFGVSTLARDNGGFNPIGYHTGSIWTHDTAICAWGLLREGYRTEATAMARTLLNSSSVFDGRWPELYGGDGVLGRPVPYPASCRPQAWSAASAAVLISVALGFEPDAPAGVLHLSPCRPAAYGAMTVRGLRFAGQEFGVRVAADGSAELLDAPDGVVLAPWEG
jgi:glycogen debranching enzyme